MITEDAEKKPDSVTVDLGNNKIKSTDSVINENDIELTTKH